MSQVDYIELNAKLRPKTCRTQAHKLRTSVELRRGGGKMIALRGRKKIDAKGGDTESVAEQLREILRSNFLKVFDVFKMCARPTTTHAPRGRACAPRRARCCARRCARIRRRAAGDVPDRAGGTRTTLARSTATSLRSASARSGTRHRERTSTRSSTHSMVTARARSVTTSCTCLLYTSPSPRDS